MTDVTFTSSPGKRRHGMIIAGLITLAGVAALASDIPDSTSIGFGALALAAVFTFHVMRTTRDPGTAMTIDGEGVWFRDWGLPKVPWRHVEGIHVTGIRLHLLIRIDLADPETFFAGLDKSFKPGPLVRKVNLVAPAGAFDATVGDVVEALREAHEAAA